MRGLQALHDRLPVRHDVHDTSTRKAFKCNLCGGDPACAHACPTAAIEYEDVVTADWIGDFARERVGYVLALEGAR